jgi:hypothetical protein
MIWAWGYEADLTLGAGFGPGLARLIAIGQPGCAVV